MGTDVEGACGLPEAVCCRLHLATAVSQYCVDQTEKGRWQGQLFPEWLPADGVTMVLACDGVYYT